MRSFAKAATPQTHCCLPVTATIGRPVFPKPLEYGARLLNSNLSLSMPKNALRMLFCKAVNMQRHSSCVVSAAKPSIEVSFA